MIFLSGVTSTEVQALISAVIANRIPINEVFMVEFSLRCFCSKDTRSELKVGIRFHFFMLSSKTDSFIVIL
jgi:hypothetical protein